MCLKVVLSSALKQFAETTLPPTALFSLSVFVFAYLHVFTTLTTSVAEPF